MIRPHCDPIVGELSMNDEWSGSIYWEFAAVKTISSVSHRLKESICYDTAYPAFLKTRHYFTSIVILHRKWAAECLHVLRRGYGLTRGFTQASKSCGKHCETSTSLLWRGRLQFSFCLRLFLCRVIVLYTCRKTSLCRSQVVKMLHE